MVNEISPKLCYKAGAEAIRRKNDESRPQGDREINNRRYIDFLEHGDNALMAKYGITIEMLNQYLNPDTRAIMDRQSLKKCDAYEKEHKMLVTKYGPKVKVPKASQQDIDNIATKVLKNKVGRPKKITENMKKNVQRINESQLRAIVAESVKNVLKEYEFDDSPREFGIPAYDNQDTNAQILDREIKELIELSKHSRLYMNAEPAMKEQFPILAQHIDRDWRNVKKDMKNLITQQP